MTQIANMNKEFRYKKRYSFVTKDKLFQFDLTVLKTSTTRETRSANVKKMKKEVKPFMEKFVIPPKHINHFNTWFNALKDTDFVELMGEKRTTYIPKKNIKASNVFNNPMNFEVEIEYIVVGGGGSMPGINNNNTPAAGGGAGGFRFASPSLAPLTYPAKPLAAPAGLTASAASFPIVIGAGGTGGAAGPPAGQAGTDGSPASFSTITSTGGGPGGYASTPGSNGGSGGGQGDHPGGFGNGNTPPVSPSQGNPGGMSVTNPSNPAPGNGSTGTGGGGGAIEAGANAGANPTNPTSGGGKGGDGAGVPNAFGTSGENCGSNYYFAGGGGGGVYTPNPAIAPGGPGGLGGGGTGKKGNDSPNFGTAGTTNTGGGGGAPGGACSPTVAKAGSNGGSGIVIIRYKFQ